MKPAGWHAKWEARPACNLAAFSSGRKRTMLPCAERCAFMPSKSDWP